jgi:hypothetical protein
MSDRSKICRCYLINPEKRTITEELYSGDFRAIQLIVGGTFDVAEFDEETRDSVYVNDEGLFEMTPWFFTVNGYPSQPLAGKGVVLGTDHEGNSVAPQITLERLKCNVTFLERGPIPFIAMRFSALDPHHGMPTDLRHVPIRATLV